ncbi:Triacylglycerol lipase 2 [Linum grandiflorum]
MSNANLQWLASFILVSGMVAMIDAVSNLDIVPSGNFSLTDNGVCRSVVAPLGYGCVEHKVTTKDGYILSLQRIAGKSGGDSKTGKPVLLQHGLFMDGVTWFLLSPGQNLAFLMADSGYDVWVVSGRGTQFSRGHVSYGLNDKTYWDWTWDELAEFDLPATVGYIHNQTNQKMHFVGHSQGNLLAMAAVSKGHLVDKLTSLTMLCPVAYMHHMSSLLMRGSINLFFAEEFYWLNIKEFDPNGGAAQRFLQKVCKLPLVDCSNLMTALTGKNCCLKPSALDSFLVYEPQPTSTRNLMHLSQMVRRGTTSMYDYDNEDDNMKHYGQPSPPVYDMAKIPTDLPIFLTYGGTDGITSEKDVQILLGTMNNHDGDNIVTQFVDNYAHADYVMAYNARQKVYEPLLAFLKQY